MLGKSNVVGVAATAVFLVAIGLGAVSASSAPMTRGERTVTLVNGTRTAMVALQIKDAGTDVWQVDMLNHRSLGIQKRIVLPLPMNPTCFYDLRAMFEDGHRVLKKHVNLCKTPEYLMTDF